MGLRSTALMHSQGWVALLCLQKGFGRLFNLKSSIKISQINWYYIKFIEKHQIMRNNNQVKVFILLALYCLILCASMVRSNMCRLPLFQVDFLWSRNVSETLRHTMSHITQLGTIHNNIYELLTKTVANKDISLFERTTIVLVWFYCRSACVHNCV